tara:strand:+ start:821 stop:1522 length:702 start_codon:yes stop_codon:yes gene_type:complete
MDLKKVLESDCDLYSIILDDYCTFEFRLLKIKEFNLFNKLLNGNIPAFILYEEIFNICYLSDAKYLSNTLPAGYAITTGQMIYTLSGGNTGEDFLISIAKEREANPLNSIYEHMRCTIFSSFHSITPVMIENMTEKQFIKNFVAAENLLSKSRPEFKRLDLEKIYKEIYNIEEPKKPNETVKDNIYINDAVSLEKELGYWDVQDAEQRFLKEEVARMNKEKLSKSDLQSLDRR